MTTLTSEGNIRLRTLMNVVTGVLKLGSRGEERLDVSRNPLDLRQSPG